MVSSILETLRVAANKIINFFYSDHYEETEDHASCEPVSDIYHKKTNYEQIPPSPAVRTSRSFVVQKSELEEAARINVLSNIMDANKSTKSNHNDDVNPYLPFCQTWDETFKVQVPLHFESFNTQIVNCLSSLKDRCSDFNAQSEFYKEKIQLARSNRREIYYSIGVEQIERGSSTPKPPLDEHKIRELKDVILRNPARFPSLYNGCTLSAKDLRTIMGNNWLNDEVINQYLKLISKRSEHFYKLPKVFNFTTFFFQKLKTSGYGSVKGWTRRVNIFSYDVIIIPIFMGAHWCLVTVDLKKKLVFYYDSLLHEFYKCLDMIREYLHEEFKKYFTFELETSDWCFECIKIIPKQFNSVDCGVFICTYAEYYSRNARFDFSQNDMPYLRDKMLLELANNSL